jgi:outer membrane immunogenic protein
MTNLPKPGLGKAGLASLMILCGGTAGAADLGSARLLPPAPELPAFYSWTGAYVGVQAGYSWGRDRTRRFLSASGAFLGSSSRYDIDGALGGAQAGFNYQLGAIVLGVEGDVEAVGGRGRVRDTGLAGRVQQDWQGSLRGRIGFAFDRFMIFGSGGASFTEFEHRLHDPVAGASESAKVSKTGWNIGAGVNFAFTENLILGAEYRYTDYGKVDHAWQGAFAGLTTEQEPRTQALRASLAYKF